jgi:restriction system protein
MSAPGGALHFIPMGNMNTDIGGLRDLITEEIGCKTGLLLTDDEALAVLRRAKHPEANIFSRNRDRYVRMRPEEIEDVIVHLRHKIGELPDAGHPVANRIRWVKALMDRGIDPSPIYEAFKTIVASGKYEVIGDEAAEEMVAIAQMPPILIAEFLLHVANQMDRSVSWFQASANALGWAIPLADVFQSETIPNDPDTYLDQRYIDYFASNSEDLNRIHWRNFERLTTEFFSRKGYEVELGPGSKDGGVDVRVWPKASGETGPPLLISQCKRYAKGNDVRVEMVKAFWTDVLYENAQHGLIATTSRVSPEGVRLSRAMKWPLGFSQQAQVSLWAKTMWRHAPNRSTTKHRQFS